MRLLEISDEERYKGRNAIHKNAVKFQDWVKELNGVPDVGTYSLGEELLTRTNAEKMV